MIDRPALLGGEPVRPQGPPPWPPRDPAIEAALYAALAEGTWGQYQAGHVDRLEQEIRRLWNVAHVLCCGSGTYAVELGLRALGVHPGDEILMAAYDYPPNFLTVHALGAMPVLVDLAPSDWQMDVTRLEEVRTERTRVVLASHLHGGLVQMRALRSWADTHGLKILEDAAQCPGAVVDGRPAGTWGDAGVLSFGGSKPLSAGRGGALLTPQAQVHQRARLQLLRGGNVVCPLSEMQAIVLLPQLAALAARNEQRRQAIARLGSLLPLRRFQNRESDQPAFYKVGWQYDAATFGLSRARFVAALRAEGIAFDEGFRGLHVGRSGSRFRATGSLDEATRAAGGAVILHHPVLLEGTTALEEIAHAVSKIQAHAEELERQS